jgi:hypothetical protein
MYWVNGLYPLVVNGVNQFQPPNPAGGVPNGTQITSAWLNDVQTELLNVLNGAGIAPEVNTPTQVLASICLLRGFNNLLLITAGQNFTIPAGVNKIRVMAVGGGGAGGPCDTTGPNQCSVGAGGNAGSYVTEIFNVVPGQSYYATIGAGGTPNGGSGGTGGSTSFGSLLTATGGKGGPSSGSPQVPPFCVAPAAPSSFGVGGITGNETVGAPGIATTINNLIGGAGAPGPFGGGAGSINGGAGLTGLGFGSGGGGAGVGANQIGQLGGAGAPGCVIVEY